MDLIKKFWSWSSDSGHQNQKTIIGWLEHACLPEYDLVVKVKIDTGGRILPFMRWILNTLGRQRARVQEPAQYSDDPRVIKPAQNHEHQAEQAEGGENDNNEYRGQASYAA